jgi:hypothetical protein
MKFTFSALLAIILLTILQSCDSTSRKKLPENFNYHAFKESIKAEKLDATGPGYESNIFESTLLTPNIDSINALLTQIDNV